MRRIFSRNRRTRKYRAWAIGIGLVAAAVASQRLAAPDTEDDAAEHSFVSAPCALDILRRACGTDWAMCRGALAQRTDGSDACPN